MTIIASSVDTVAAGLMAAILEQARNRGWSQSELATRASVPESSISRIKRSGRADLDTLAKLASAVGLRLTLVPDRDYAEKLARGELF
ncbi:helix-turn-helix domain-containing protein [Thiogranum longum]|jgi:transcriptional regulator with XRE-family HTH domain